MNCNIKLNNSLSLIVLNYKNEIKLVGTIKFDPPDKTQKHLEQSSWKKIAMIIFEETENSKGGICDYYSWFINKRFNIKLLRPLRGAHITFINDREGDIKGDWEKVKKKWDSKKIEVILNVEPRTDSAETKKNKITHNWWLNVSHEHRNEIQSIRNELRLGLPFFGLHMTIGRAENFKKISKDNSLKAKEMNIKQSIYIHSLIKKGYITF